MTDITACRTWEELPEQAKEYVGFVARDLKVPIKWIGVGPASDAMIVVPDDAIARILGD